MNVRTGLLSACAIVAVAGLGGGVLSVNVHVNHQTADLEHQVTSLRQQLSQAVATVQNDDVAVSNLTNQLANLTRPNDPLANYNAVCNMPLTNNASGITQTYWFPCTNSATTIPQPAG